MIPKSAPLNHQFWNPNENANTHKASSFGDKNVNKKWSQKWTKK